MPNLSQLLCKQQETKKSICNCHLPSEGELLLATKSTSWLAVVAVSLESVLSVNGFNGARYKQSEFSIEYWTIENQSPNQQYFVCFANLYFALFIFYCWATIVFSYFYLPVTFSCTFLHFYTNQIKTFVFYFCLLAYIFLSFRSVLLVSFCCSMFQSLFDCWNIFIFFLLLNLSFLLFL